MTECVDLILTCENPISALIMLTLVKAKFSSPHVAIEQNDKANETVSNQIYCDKNAKHCRDSNLS